MKSIIYRPTGKIVRGNGRAELAQAEKEIHPQCIIRNNEICAPEYLEDYHLNGKSIFKRMGDHTSGVDQRVNAVGDEPANATGYQIQTDTLTYIIKEITRQSFYLEPVGQHIPIRIGEGAFSRALLTNRTYSLADDPESGFVREGGGQQRLSMVDVTVDGVTTYIANWIKGVEYSLIDVEQALRANNWDLITELHIARKTNWDLLVQKIAMIGSTTDTRMPGLLTNANVTTDTGVIPTFISQMNASQLQTFVSTLIQTYFANSNSTAKPNTFLIPYADWNGLPVLTTGTVGTYPVPLIKYLEEAFTMAVKDKEANFRIIPSAYCDAAHNPSGLNIYMLYRDDARSLRMNIPVDYTVTQAGTINNLQFQDAAYAQITGVTILKNLEVMKFTHS